MTVPPAVLLLLTVLLGTPPAVSVRQAPPAANGAGPASTDMDGAQASDAETPVCLAAERLYVGLNRPVVVAPVGLAPGAQWGLVLMEFDGRELFRAETIDEREADLAQLHPEIWSLPQAAWLQLLVDGVPTGAPLVVQPLRNRPPVRTAQALRPDRRTPYTRIIGWGDQLLDPDNPEHAKLRETWTPGEPIVMSGLRLYPDRDVLLETSLGSIRVALRPDEAPNTAWNFRHLAEGGFYDGTVFHRVVPADRQGRPFVIQGGDPTGAGDGGPGWDLPMERSRLEHDFGVISMARADHPDSAGSQFFFCLSREGTARLDTQYCAFGKAVEGADVILGIAAVELADPATGRPAAPPEVKHAALVPAPPRTPGVGRPEAPLPAPPPPEETESGHQPR